MRRWCALGAVALLFALISAGVAFAWTADFTADGASGTPTYEAMAIYPQAVYSARFNTTYIVFQGSSFDPYITAYDHTKATWLPTYKVGTNHLARDDTHGAPALVIDGNGHLHVFFGGHANRDLYHARSSVPGSISAWLPQRTIRPEGDLTTLVGATYPQPMLTADGIELFYRNGDRPPGSLRAGQWESIETTNGLTWSAAERVIGPGLGDGTDTLWYASFSRGATGTVHAGFIHRDVEAGATDFYVRRDLFYMRRSDDGVWRNAEGAALEPTRTVEYLRENALVTDSGDEYTNQVVVREAPDGSPALLYLIGSHEPVPAYRWEYRRWDGTAWSAPVTVTTTDHFFDAADFVFDASGNAHAYLVSGGQPDDQANSGIPDELRAAARGGDIEHWVLRAGESTWRKESTVKASPGPSERYNDPQIVFGADSPSVGVLFSDWNNDWSNYTQKVYLYTGGRFLQRRFTPEITRLAGENRIETAIQISKETFPTGAPAVVIASAADYADALCGIPLAQSYRAPILLSSPSFMSSALEKEIDRLLPDQGPCDIIVLGGERAISPAVESRLATLAPNATVARLSGPDRYATSVAIARKLAERRGLPSSVVVASGEGFADALAVSPYAARRGVPVLLSRQARLPESTAAQIAEFAPGTVVLVGGEAALGSDVMSACKSLAPTVDRWWGPDRYATAASVVEHALAVGHTLQRPVIASGATFADAVPGGLLAARCNSVVVLTKPDRLPTASEGVLRRATRVLEAYVLGGPVALSPAVENNIASVLMQVEAP
jgi:putative cell wall-binding protein